MLGQLKFIIIFLFSLMCSNLYGYENWWRFLPLSNETRTCFAFQSEVSEEGGQIGRPVENNISFAYVNGIGLPFNILMSKSGNKIINGKLEGKKDIFTVSTSCLSNSKLKVGKNNVSMSFIHQDSETGMPIRLTEGWSRASLGYTEYFEKAPPREICRDELRIGNEFSDGCEKVETLTLEDINPGLYNNLRWAEEWYNGQSSNLYTKRSDTKDYDNALYILNKYKDYSFENLSSEMFSELKWALDEYERLKNGINLTKEEIDNKIEDISKNVDQIKKSVNEDLASSGIDPENLPTLTLENIGALETLQIESVINSTSEITEKDNFYDELANQTIAELERLYRTEDRNAFLVKIENWTQVVDSLKNIVAARASIYPDELKFFINSITKVKRFIFADPGYLDPDLWFKNSPVPVEVRNTIEKDIVPNAPTAGELLKKELKSWKGRELTAQQKRIIETVIVLGEGFKYISGNLAEDFVAAKNKWIEIATGFANVVNTVRCGASIVLLNDYVDIYEVTTGRDFCDGSELSNAEIAFTVSAGVLTSGFVLRKIYKHLSFSPKIKSIVNRIDEFIHRGLSESKIKEVLKKAKGSRPHPSTYLSESYIKSHLKNFDEGASYFVPKDVLDDFGRQLLGRVDGQFIMSKRELDLLWQETSGNFEKIEKALGINPGDWANRTMVRIDIPNPKNLNIRIPTGNEKGAIDGLWIPGGKLPCGYLEAVVDQIPIGKYIETVLP